MIINPVETKNALKEAVATVGSKKSVGSGKQEISEKIGKAKELLLSQRTVEGNLIAYNSEPKPDPVCSPDRYCGNDEPEPEPKPEPEPCPRPCCGGEPEPEPEPEPWPECGTVPKPEPEPDPEPWFKPQPEE